MIKKILHLWIRSYQCTQEWTSMIERWVLEKIEPLRKENLIILRDPQRMIQAGAYVVDGWAER